MRATNTKTARCRAAIIKAVVYIRLAFIHILAPVMRHRVSLTTTEQRIVDRQQGHQDVRRPRQHRRRVSSSIGSK